MTKLKFAQSWVDRMTSDFADDVTVLGRDVVKSPTVDEMAAILQKAADSNAVREMVRRKWFGVLAKIDRHIERGRALQEFLFSEKLDRPEFVSAALFRRQRRQKDLVEEIATMAWLCHIDDKASTFKKLQFDRAKLNQKTITHIVRLSRLDSGPRDAISYLERLGIRIVIESSLPGMRVDGASFVSPNAGPIIGLTLRYDRLDNFWFTLLHELGHIVLHLRDESSEVFIDSIEDEDSEESEIEAEANAFAKDSFIPRDAWMRSDAFRLESESAILALADKFHIHPAIVAGRIRFERKRYQAFPQLLGTGQVRSALLTE